jgi:cell wall-associated NlpC family hydrolase
MNDTRTGGRTAAPRRILLAAAAAAALVLPAGGFAQAVKAAQPGQGNAAVAEARQQPPVSLPVRVVRTAMSMIGVPYVHGGAGSEGVDCSGLVYRVFKDTAGLNLPRGVAGLMGSGTLARSPIHIGDLLFFDTSDRGGPADPTHVGIYAGNDRFVHAASEGPRRGVIVSSLSESYYRERFIGARRVIPWRSPELRVTLSDQATGDVQSSPFASRENLKLVVSSEMTGGGPVELRVYKDGEEIVMRRIVPSEARPAELSIVPDKGQWEVRVSRLYRGRELLRVGFTVEE